MILIGGFTFLDLWRLIGDVAVPVVSKYIYIWLVD